MTLDESLATSKLQFLGLQSNEVKSCYLSPKLPSQINMPCFSDSGSPSITNTYRILHFVQGTFLSNCIQTFSLHQNYEMDIEIFHFIGEKMRHREVKELAMGHTAWKWKSSDLNVGIWLQSSLAYPLYQEVPPPPPPPRPHSLLFFW